MSPDLPQLAAALDAQWAAIAAAQSAYAAEHGRYAQLGWTHSEPPPEGVYLAPDLSGASFPEHTIEAWAALGALPALMRSRLRIDVYAGPRGVGFMAVQQALAEGRLYERCRQSGPETEREQPEWREVQP